MKEVTITDVFRTRNLQDFSAPAAQRVDQRRIRVVPDSIEIPSMKELLKPSIDSVPALVGEQPEEPRSRDQTVFVGCTEEIEVAVLECDRRAVGRFGTSESRETTTG